MKLPPLPPGERDAHFATHQALQRADLKRWLEETERLPDHPAEEVYDYEGRLWLRNCKACGSTISRVVPRTRNRKAR